MPAVSGQKMSNSINNFLTVAFNFFMILSYALILVGAVMGEISVNFARTYSALGFIFYVLIIVCCAFIEHKNSNKQTD